MPVSSRQIATWLAEDLGRHDVTTDVPGDTTGRLVAKDGGTAAGLAAAAAVFEHLDCTVESRFDDGDDVTEGEVVLRVSGPARAVLRAERVAVNLAGHASGIATATSRAVDVASEAGENCRVAATRKTTPGLRGVEKRAVAAAGGDTHRLDQSHAVMVKDNHVAELGIERAVERFRERASVFTTIEVEVESVAGARRAVDAGADAVLFDNLSPGVVADGVAAVGADVLTEASGNVTLDDLDEYAATGVDVVSMGWLTQDAPALDYSFRTGTQ